LDNENGNSHWVDAIKKVMTIEVLESNDAITVGYTMIPLKIIFDLKLDFTRKSRLVAGGTYDQL